VRQRLEDLGARLQAVKRAFIIAESSCACHQILGNIAK
jgi:hypothetical protein